MDINEVMKLPYGAKVIIAGRGKIVREVRNPSLFDDNRNITSYFTIEEIVNFEFTEIDSEELLGIKDVLCKEMVDHLVQRVVCGELRSKFRVVYIDDAYDLMSYGHNEGDYIGDLEYLSDILESGFIDLGIR